MTRPSRLARRAFAAPFALVALVAGCAPTPAPVLEAAGPRPSRMMDGCGMMVDGKMVYKKLAQGESCMNMEKPGSRMPNGVTMHPDPGYAD